jgi:hypothetical protein
MVFGNTLTVQALRDSIPQQQVFAMRASRAIPLTELTRTTGLTADELKRFNPALVRQVPKGATVYLPFFVDGFGPDVSFWHRPASPEYAAVLNDFVRLDVNPETLDDASFESVMRAFRKRFEDTNTEEGNIMAIAITYVLGHEASTRSLMAEYRSSQKVQTLFQRAVREREAGAPPKGSPDF